MESPRPEPFTDGLPFGPPDRVQATSTTSRSSAASMVLPVAPSALIAPTRNLASLAFSPRIGGTISPSDSGSAPVASPDSS